MLPSDLLFSNRRGKLVVPRFLRPDQQVWAEAVLATLEEYRQRPRGELMEALRSLEGDSTDYRIVRGFAHLALADAVFSLALPGVEPETLRRQAFTLAAQQAHFGADSAQTVLAILAERHGLEPALLRDGLYADLPERQILTALPAYTPQTLVDRYNLAQAQGLLYSAVYLRITAHRNVPGEYRRLFQQLKFHGLMYAVEGSLEDGYQIYVDGPASLFKLTRKYGINMAVFLPALLHLTRWELEAVLRQGAQEFIYRLNSESPLRSHHAKPPAYDSLLERAFAERWAQLDTPWVLEREVEIVDLKGTVMVPDFALRHPDGRTVHLEIMGFWHPDYLRRKLDKVRRAGMRNLILAISERLNVGSEQLENIAGPVLFFKGKLEPRRVLERVEGTEVLNKNT